MIRPLSSQRGLDKVLPGKKTAILAVVFLWHMGLASQSLVPCNCGADASGKLLYGYCDSLNNKNVIRCQYDSAYPFRSGLGRVIRDGKTGYVDPAGKLVIPAGFEWGGDFSEGLAFVKKDGKCFYINKTGANAFKRNFYFPAPPLPAGASEAVVKMLKAQETEAVRTAGFSEGMALFMDSAAKRYGFMDTKGAVVLPPKYGIATRFTEGLAFVRETPVGPAFAINKKGEKQFDLRENQMPMPEGFVNGFCRVMGRPDYNRKDFNIYNYVDKKGNFLLASSVSEAKPFHGNFAVIARRSGEIELVNRQGKSVLPDTYNYLEPSSIKGIYYFNRVSGKGYGLIDTTGKIIATGLYGQGYVNFEKINDTVFLCKPWGTRTYTLLSTRSGDLFGTTNFNGYSWRLNGKKPVLQLSISYMGVTLEYEPSTGKFFENGKELSAKDNIHLAVNSKTPRGPEKAELFKFENTHFRLKFPEGMELYKDSADVKVFNKSTFFFAIREHSYKGSAREYLNSLQASLQSGGEFEKVEPFRLATDWGGITYLKATEKKKNGKTQAVLFYAALEKEKASPAPGKLYTFYGNYFLMDERIDEKKLTSILYSITFK